MLDAKFYDALVRLRLSIGHKSSMSMSGNRKSVQKGSSAEFSDFREYMPGDDIRRIDWNAYARLDKLFIKEYMEEKEAVVSILIDTSASMNYGEEKKSELALSIAAALSYLALSGMDRVVVYDMKRMANPYIVTGGKKGYPRLLKWLEQLSFDGAADIHTAIRQMAMKGPGMTILISDFLTDSMVNGPEEEIEKLMKYLDYRRQKTVMLHVMAEEELEIGLSGTYHLIDMESQEQLRITMNAEAIRDYQKGLQNFLNKLQQSCRRTGSSYVLCSTARDLYQLIFEDLRVLYDI